MSKQASRTCDMLVMLLALGVLVTLAGVAGAQTVSGYISGTVVDSSGLPVPGAQVTLINEATGEQRTQQSNAAGDFVFSAVLPGRYTVAVEAKGFKRVEKQNLNITASERLAAGQFVLEVGSITEAITVTAEGTPVQVASPERSAVLTSSQISALMARGRDFFTLLKVLPGVVPPSEMESLGRTPMTNIQGMRMSYPTVSIDGVSSNDLGSEQVMGAPMNLDAVGEIKVLMTNYQAEYGRTAGALVQVVTRSGTREYHGSAYYYKRHEMFNANNFFANRLGQPRPRYRYNTWGYNLGGPVPFRPTKERLFFFFSHEILPTSTPQAIQNVTVPTEAQRRGDFSAQLPNIVIRDPFTRTPFAGNIVPANRIDPNGQKLLSLFPLPNVDPAVSRGAYNYSFQEVIPATRHSPVYRVDYNATDKLRLYLRGSNFRLEQTGYLIPGAASGAAWGMLKARNRYDDDTGVLNATYTINPTTVNEFNFGAHYARQLAVPASQADLDRVSRSKNGINIPQFYPQYNVIDLIPWATFGGITGAARFVTDSRFPTKSVDTVFNISNSLSKIWRQHTFKAGIFYERPRYFSSGAGTNFGNFDFSSDANNPLDSGYAYANALMGVFRSYEESSSRVETNGRAYTLEWFVQDSWRVTRRLTLDIGVRFSLYRPFTDAKSQAASFMPDRWDRNQAPRLYHPVLNERGQRVAYDPVTGATAPAVLISAIIPNSGNTANGMVIDDGKVIDRGLMKHQGVLYAPRFGFAWDVFGDGKTAIRGGFGIFYNTRERVLLLDVARTPPIQYTPIVYYGTFATLLQSAGTLFPVSTAGLATRGDVPSVYNFSFGIQRSLGFSTVLDLAYVGSLGRHLLALRNINALPYGFRFLPTSRDYTTGRPLPDVFLAPYRGYSSVTIDEFSTGSHYNSMQLQVNRRFTRGLQFGAAWTWSKSMDYGSNDWASIAQWAPRRVWNYGNSDFDRTHIVQIHALWEVPKLSRLVKNRIVGVIGDNWQLSGIASFVSGEPRGLSLTTTTGLDIAGGGDGVRPVVLANPVLPKSERTLMRFIRQDVYALPELGTFGNAARMVFRGPGINNFDLAVNKYIPLYESLRLLLRFEAYNAFNHTQFSGVNTTVQINPATGQQVNAALGTITSARTPRVGQASLRLLF
ncbi:MAG: carboxypeptidase regulatory-like domain-containing protein [Bryobacterales bacterium]|nr:carboxypeptidase regulatory-like domain-containing protein [Bryobacterales bacterium]